MNGAGVHPASSGAAHHAAERGGRSVAIVSSVGGVFPERAMRHAERRGVSAIEWSNDVFRVPLSERGRRDRRAFMQGGPIERHCIHGSFSDIDLLSSDAAVARCASTMLERELRFAATIDATVFTIHIAGSRIQGNEVDLEGGRRRLRDLAAVAHELGVPLCIENLRGGLTDDPQVLAAWAGDCSVGVTIDFGHMHADVEDDAERLDLGRAFIDRVAPFVVHAHVYEREAARPSRHVAGTDDRYLGPMLEHLGAATDCRSITLEYWEEPAGVDFLIDVAATYWS